MVKSVLMKYSDIQTPVRQLLRDSEERLKSLVGSKGRLAHSLLQRTPLSKGKKIRSTLLFLLAGLYDTRPADLPDVAAAVELFHLSSLIHDDIVDNSNFRRGEKTLHNHFGPYLSVLWGDYLFITSLKILSDLDRPPLVKLFSNTSRQMIEGQLLEYQYTNRATIPRRKYYEIIEKKTSSLFASIAAIIGVLQGHALDSPVTRGFQRFGNSFGMIFQISDDILDIFSSSSGKDRFRDFYEGKITLPYILLFRDHSPEEVREIAARKDHRAMLDLFTKSRVQERSRAVVERYHRDCLRFLAEAPDSPCKQSLLALLHFIKERDF